MRILVAEDDRVSRKFMGEFMSAYGEVDVAVDGMEALDLYMDAIKKKKPYDLGCIDIMMPRVDGLKFVKVVRTLEAQHAEAGEHRLRIIMMTALADADYVDRAFKLGCDAYASKPVDTERVVEVMKNLGLLED